MDGAGMKKIGLLALGGVAVGLAAGVLVYTAKVSQRAQESGRESKYRQLAQANLPRLQVLAQQGDPLAVKVGLDEVFKLEGATWGKPVHPEAAELWVTLAASYADPVTFAWIPHVLLIKGCTPAIYAKVSPILANLMPPKELRAIDVSNFRLEVQMYQFYCNKPGLDQGAPGTAFNPQTSENIGLIGEFQATQMLRK